MTAEKGPASGSAMLSPEKLAQITDGDPNVVVIHQDLRELTNGQVEEIEDLLDMPILEVFDPTKKQGKNRRTVAYVVRKADDPLLTYEDSYRLKLWLYDPTADVEAEAKSNGNGKAPAAGSRPPTRPRRTGAKKDSSTKSP